MVLKQYLIHKQIEFAFPQHAANFLSLLYAIKLPADAFYEIYLN